MKYIEGLLSVEGGYYRTGSRTPMQWDHSVNKGFSRSPSDRLYLPVDQDENAPTVEGQLADPGSLLHEIRKLIAIRKEHPALQNTASVEFLPMAGNRYPLAYIRRCRAENILVVINPSHEEQKFICHCQTKEKIYSLNGDMKKEGSQLSIPGQTAVFYTIQ